MAAGAEAAAGFWDAPGGGGTHFGNGQVPTARREPEERHEPVDVDVHSASIEPNVIRTRIAERLLPFTKRSLRRRWRRRDLGKLQGERGRRIRKVQISSARREPEGRQEDTNEHRRGPPHVGARAVFQAP